jgi:hypothetical protein
MSDEKRDPTHDEALSPWQPGMDDIGEYPERVESPPRNTSNPYQDYED